jgi:hypothetical protein
MRGIKYILFLSIGLLFLSCEKDPPAPVITDVSPAFGPAGELVTFEGMNLANIREVTFSGQLANFNTAYNSDVALLFRVPTNIPLGEHEVVIKTDGGTVSTSFRITLDPPSIFSVTPEFASPGDIVTITGKNFFEPMEVYFFDSVQAEILSLFPDSMEVIVPEGIEKGKITVNANGGVATSPVNFFSVNSILVNDFDGNGIRSETNKWGFTGQIDQNAFNSVHNSNPEPISDNFLKLTGTDDLAINWIGGAQSHFGFPGDDFETFNISTDINNTLLEMDINNNGRTNTHIILILLEHEGLTSDFTHEIHVDWDGWDKISVPLNRFSNFEGVLVDPAKVKLLKVHLIDNDDSNTLLEVNIDNIRFVEIL